MSRKGVCVCEDCNNGSSHFSFWELGIPFSVLLTSNLTPQHSICEGWVAKELREPREKELTMLKYAGIKQKKEVCVI